MNTMNFMFKEYIITITLLVLLADVLKNFWNKRFWNIWGWFYSFFSCTKISMASSFKRTKVKLDLLNNINMLLMVENLSICKIKDCDKNRQSFYLKKSLHLCNFWDVNSLYITKIACTWF